MRAIPVLTPRKKWCPTNKAMSRRLPHCKNTVRRYMNIPKGGKLPIVHELPSEQSTVTVTQQMKVYYNLFNPRFALLAAPVLLPRPGVVVAGFRAFSMTTFCSIWGLCSCLAVWRGEGLEGERVVVVDDVVEVVEFGARLEFEVVDDEARDRWFGSVGLDDAVGVAVRNSAGGSYTIISNILLLLSLFSSSF
jgi:hypothetical protein